MGLGLGEEGSIVQQRVRKCWELKKKKQKHLSLKFTVHASALTKPNLLGFLSDRAGWSHWLSLSACAAVCSCSSLVFYVSVSGSFCVTSSPLYPSFSFSLSLGVPHFSLMSISVSDHLIGFHSVPILSFWSPLNRTHSSLLSREDFKKFCLISTQKTCFNISTHPD